MYKFLAKNGQVVGFGLGALVSALFLISWLTGISSMMALPEEERFKTGIFDVGLIGAFLLFIITIALLLVFGALQTANNFKGSIKGLIGIAVLVIIFFIFYATASVETSGIVADAAKKMGTSDNIIKLISAGINTTVVLFVGSFIALIISELRNFFK